MDTTNKITDTNTDTNTITDTNTDTDTVTNTIATENKYCTNHPSQKKAAKKYYDNNKDVIYQRLKEKLKNDPEFKQKRLEYARRSREKKKLLKTQNKNNDLFVSS